MIGQYKLSGEIKLIIYNLRSLILYVSLGFLDLVYTKEENRGCLVYYS